MSPLYLLRPADLSRSDVKRHVLFWCVALSLVVACGKKPRVVSPPVAGSGVSQRGLASWYGVGDGYHGKRTASGERFNRDELTAAHFSLPFGTYVRVTNLKNDKEIVVRINDRFPRATLDKGRIIDLSYRAAQLLEMVRDGVVPVIVEVVSSAD